MKSILLSILILIGMFFLYALIFQALYNYSVPSIVSSFNPDFDEKRYKKISYWKGCASVLMLVLFLAPTITVFKMY